MGKNIAIDVHGACSGSPGVMGIGGVISKLEDNEIIYSFSFSEAVGSDNKAKLLAAKKALEITRELGLDFEEILIRSHSHLMICQLSYGMALGEEEQIIIKEIINEIIVKFSCKIRFQWIPREKNCIAEILAAKGARMPSGLVQEGNVVTAIYMEEKEIDGENFKILPKVNEETMFQIRLLNCSNNIDFSKLFSLMSFGVDKYSRARKDDLLKYIEIRFGEETRNYLLQVLEDLNSYYSKLVLRWTARGLKPSLAFIKARMETEIRENNVQDIQ